MPSLRSYHAFGARRFSAPCLRSRTSGVLGRVRRRPGGRVWAFRLSPPGPPSRCRRLHGVPSRAGHRSSRSAVRFRAPASA